MYECQSVYADPDKKITITGCCLLIIGCRQAMNFRELKSAATYKIWFFPEAEFDGKFI